jgi:hypothetical protein
MSTQAIEESFARSWRAELLTAAPLIAPAQQYVYPMQVPGEEETLARGAVQVLIHPAPSGTFLATFALGFSDPRMPRGIWTCPRAEDLCALAGGYAYLLDTAAPARCELLALRPVVQVIPVPAQQLLLFIGINEVFAWSAAGLAWKTARLSWEGLAIQGVSGAELHGSGWDMHTDRELPFVVDLSSGAHTGGAFPGSVRPGLR